MAQQPGSVAVLPGYMVKNRLVWLRYKGMRPCALYVDAGEAAEEGGDGI
jgi:hypothetical protein